MNVCYMFDISSKQLDTVKVKRIKLDIHLNEYILSVSKPDVIYDMNNVLSVKPLSIVI